MQVNIGKIVNTHGIRGELKVVPTTDFPEERFAAGAAVNLTYAKKTETFTIAHVRVHKGCLLVSFKGISNITEVEKYKDCVLWVEAEHEDDDFYYDELIGCQVYASGELIGEVSEILETQAHEILRVVRENGKDVLIPYVENFILDVDIDENRIDVSLIEGML